MPTQSRPAISRSPSDAVPSKQLCCEGNAGHMKYLIATLLILLGGYAFADPPQYPDVTDGALVDQRFLREYAMGVQRLPMDGGKIYGWQANDSVSFGRFKGESDEFGFSFSLNPRDRLEVTIEGLRWRRSIGGSR